MYMVDVVIHLSLSDCLSLIGSLFSFLGVVLLTLVGIFGDRPLKRIKQLLETDRGELSEGGPTYDLMMEEVVSRSPDGNASSSPVTTGDYDALRRRLIQSIFGVVFTALGFLMQVVSILVV